MLLQFNVALKIWRDPSHGPFNLLGLRVRLLAQLLPHRKRHVCIRTVRPIALITFQLLVQPFYCYTCQEALRWRSKSNYEITTPTRKKPELINIAHGFGRSQGSLRGSDSPFSDASCPYSEDQKSLRITHSFSRMAYSWEIRTGANHFFLWVTP